MTRICKVTGKKPLVGHKISHSNIKTKRRFLVNLKSHRFWLTSQKRFIRLRVSAKGIRIIDKLGIETVLTRMGAFVNDIKKAAKE